MSASDSPFASIAFGSALALLVAMAWFQGGISPELAEAQQNACANAQIRDRQSSEYLPDCRAFEQVSPTHKNGLDAGYRIFPGNGPPLQRTAFFAVKAATDGSAIAFNAQAPMGDTDGAGAPLRPQIVSRRSADGWTSRTVNPPFDATSGNDPNGHHRVWGFTDDLSKAIIIARTNPLTAGAAPNRDNYYLMDLQTRDYKLLSPGVTGITSGGGMKGGAHSDDLTHVAFQFDLPSVNMMDVVEGYIDGTGTSKQRVVSIDPATDQPVGAATLGAGWSGNHLGGGNESPSAMSGDGSRTLFMTGTGHELLLTPSDPPSDLYLRDTEPDGGGPAITAWVSEPEAGVPADPTSPRLDAFWDASTDASTVIFTSGEKLTVDSTADPTPGSFGDLYAYDYEADDLRDISIDTGHAEGARVLGVVRVSDSGDDVYFVARGTLGTGEGQDGEPNLFHWRDGPGNGVVTFIGTLAPHTQNVFSSDFDIYQPSSFDRNARVSSDGQLLLFQSLAQLTGGDQDSDRDVYLYDSQENTLQCLSCATIGDELGQSTLRPDGGVKNNLGILQTYPPNNHFTIYRNITQDGSTVFFQSEDALVPGDVNGQQDVYSYKIASGDIALLTSGQSRAPAFFVAASADGSNVFIATRERLVRSDVDGLYDIYDVRVGGGLATQNRPPVPECSGDECQGEGARKPSFEIPGSAEYSGRGNDVAERNRRDCRSLHRKARRKRGKAGRLVRKARRVSGKRARKNDRRAKRAKRGAKRAKRRARKINRRAKRAKRSAKRAKRNARTCRKAR